MPEQGKKDLREISAETIVLVVLMVLTRFLPAPAGAAIGTASALYMTWSLIRFIRKHRKERKHE